MKVHKHSVGHIFFLELHCYLTTLKSYLGGRPGMQESSYSVDFGGEQMDLASLSMKRMVEWLKRPPG